MDYLPLPLHPIHEIIEVPYLGGGVSIYDHPQPTMRRDRDWEVYPERAGWIPRSFQDWYTDFETRYKELFPLIQTWFFFGLLENVTEEPLPYELFVKDGIHGRYIHAHSIDAIVKRKAVTSAQEMKSITGPIIAIQSGLRSFWRDRVGSHMMNATKKVSLCEFLQQSALSHLEPMLFSVILSIWSITETLWLSFVEDHPFAPYVPGAEFGQCFSLPMHLTSPSNLLRHQMLEDNWCPFELARFRARFNTPTIYFLSQLRRPQFQTHFHAITSEDVGVRSLHSKPSQSAVCTDFRCAAHQINENDYRTKHTESCESCEDLIADPNIMNQILESGSYPLLSASSIQGPAPTIELIPRQPGVVYVAISHVWSDGLGNVQRNALPACQLRRLGVLVTNVLNVSTQCYFWLDTICCPRKDRHFRDLAISKMRQTYAEAALVLVLDSSLLRQSLSSITPVEILLRVLVSSWNGRLWTLQEGALADRLFFQFADGAYALNLGLNELDQIINEKRHWSVFKTINRQFFNLYGFRSGSYSLEDKVQALAMALEFRTTSNNSDEALCLATLLELDVSSLLRGSKATRMQNLWAQFDHIPLGVIFDWVGPRLDAKGFRWAPKTFMANQGARESGYTANIFGATGSAQRCFHGLKFYAQGWLIRYTGFQVGDRFYLRDLEGVWWFVICAIATCPNRIKVQDCTSTHPTWQDQVPEQMWNLIDPMDGFDLPAGCEHARKGIGLAIIWKDMKSILTVVRCYHGSRGIFMKYVCGVKTTRMTKDIMSLHAHNIDVFEHSIGFSCTAPALSASHEMLEAASVAQNVPENDALIID